MHPFVLDQKEYLILETGTRRVAEEVLAEAGEKVD